MERKRALHETRAISSVETLRLTVLAFSTVVLSLDIELRRCSLVETQLS
jgi:hypothetical protein